MKRYELIAPCHFGVEAMLKREIIDLGYDVTLVEDGRVTFIGDESAALIFFCARRKGSWSKRGAFVQRLTKSFFREQRVFHGKNLSLLTAGFG